MIELTDKQHQELEDSIKEVRVLDPATRKEYVLVGAEDFVRWQKLLEEALDVREQEGWAAAVEEARSQMSQE